MVFLFQVYATPKPKGLTEVQKQDLFKIVDKAAENAQNKNKYTYIDPNEKPDMYAIGMATAIKYFKENVKAFNEKGERVNIEFNTSSPISDSSKARKNKFENMANGYIEKSIESEKERLKARISGGENITAEEIEKRMEIVGKSSRGIASSMIYWTEILEAQQESQKEKKRFG